MNNDEKLELMAKRAREAYAKNVETSAPKWKSGDIEECVVPTCAGVTRMLIYRPCQSTNPGLPPVFVNIHGGGFIQGSAEDDDPWCRNIAEEVACIVVNIEYHLAPEYPFPVALEECYDVLRWIKNQGGKLGMDVTRLAVGGHSAGGNLTAALCLLARERKEFLILYQVLNYPPLDFTIDPFSKPSRDTLLTPNAQVFFTACYLKNEERRSDPLASPVLAKSLEGLPDALIISAEYDPLRGENELYARRLSEAGVAVTYRMFAGCMHAFTHFGPEAAAREAWELIRANLKQVFRRSG
ncbi:MAG: alpha/beta hydrolase [Negativicutes bacterium]